MKHTVERVKLKNGVEGLLINIPDATVMSYDFNLRAGYYLAPKNKWEVPHVMEHLLCGANEKFPKARQFEAEVKRNGAYTNAYTNNYSVGYIGECADFEWDRILELLLLSISKPLFLEQEFKAEMGNVREEMIGFLDHYYRQLFIALSQRLGFPVQPDRQRVAELPSITLDDIKAHYHKTHTRQNVRFIIAGKTKARRQKIQDLLENSFSLPGGKRIGFPKDHLKRPKGVCFIPNETVDSLYISVAMLLPYRLPERDFEALLTLNNVLTATFNSRILGELRERGLSYHIWGSIHRGEFNSEQSFDFQASKENTKEAIRVIVRHLKEVVNGDVSEAELEAAKNYALGSYQMSAQTVHSVLSGYSGEYFLMDEVDDFYRAPERIKAVKLPEVTNTARLFYEEKIWDLGVLGNCSQEFAAELKTEFATLWK